MSGQAMDSDLDLLRDKPDFKAILRAILRHQMKYLVQQLSVYGDEEVMVLATNLSDGAFSHLGSSGTLGFLDNREYIKSQFMGHCIKNRQSHSTEKKKIVKKDDGHTEDLQKIAKRMDQPTSDEQVNLFESIKDFSVSPGSTSGEHIESNTHQESGSITQQMYIDPQTLSQANNTVPVTHGDTDYNQFMLSCASHISGTYTGKKRTGLKRPRKTLMSDKSVKRKTVSEQESMVASEPSATVTTDNESDEKTEDVTVIEDTEHQETQEMEQSFGEGDSSYRMIKVEPVDVDDETEFSNFIKGQLDKTETDTSHSGINPDTSERTDMEGSNSSFARGWDDMQPENLNKNTWHKISSDLRTFQEWARSNDEYRNLEDIPPDELDKLLSRMFLGMVRKDGSEYEPETLKSIFNSINRRIHDLHLPFDIKTDAAFSNTRRVLETRVNSLKAIGKGKKYKKPMIFTARQIQVLHEKKLLGGASPEALLSSLWLNNRIFFGMKRRENHTTLLWGDIVLRSTTDGQEYLELIEITDADIKVKGEPFRRTSYLGSFKLEVVKFAEEYGNYNAVKVFNLPDSSIRTWVRQKEKLQALEDSKSSRLNTLYRLKAGQWPELEKKLKKFILEKKAEGKTLTNKSIQEIALKMALQLGIKNFRATNGWMARFKRRMDL